jgi:hypothetical protein
MMTDRAKTTEEISALCVQMAVDSMQLLPFHGGIHLTHGGLATTATQVGMLTATLNSLRMIQTRTLPFRIATKCCPAVDVLSRGLQSLSVVAKGASPVTMMYLQF